MLIIVPESCQSPSELSYGDSVRHEMFLALSANRTGEKNRDYKASVYRLIVDNEAGVGLCFSGECPACLQTLYEIQSDGLTGLTPQQLANECQVFQQTLRSLLTHPANVDCHGQYELVQWTDPASNKPEAVNIDVFLQNLFQHRKFLDYPLAQRCTAVSQVHGNNANESFHAVPCYGNSVVNAYLHSTVGCYKMSGQTRGLCLLISIVPPGDRGQNEQHHVNSLKELFQGRFGLNVQVLDGELDKDDLRSGVESVYSELAKHDVDDVDVFVCCIISPGSLGLIQCADGEQLSVLQLANTMNDHQCPELKGKPKLFLVHTFCLLDGDIPATVTFNAGLPSREARTSSVINDNVSGIMQAGVVCDGPEADAAPEPVMSSSPPTVIRSDGDLLVPRSPDYIISYSVVRYRHQTSFYVKALLDKLTSDVDILQTLTDIQQQISRQLMAEMNTVSTATKRLVLPPPLSRH
jgi:hypothetical protein